MRALFIKIYTTLTAPFKKIYTIQKNLHQVESSVHKNLHKLGAPSEITSQPTLIHRAQMPALKHEIEIDKGCLIQMYHQDNETEKAGDFMQKCDRVLRTLWSIL